MQKILDKWVMMLKLKDWKIQLIEERTLDTEATTKTIYNDYQAVIRIKDELSIEEKEKALIHELLHLIHRDELDIARDNLQGYNDTLYVRFHERTIEKMAQILYEISIKERSKIIKP